ncbi:MAG: tryptophan--tRNA ligase [Bacillota bacterium]|nr:tryptophan--tRNA ligase [Bacillota bacterium]
MKRIFSGVQPSGKIHLGNYITMKNFKNHQLDKECFYCIVDLHAITVEQDREELRRKSIELAALYIAIGLDPKKVTVFIQSQVSAHAELAWILQCNSYMGELSRMTQFKDKSSKNESVTNGLFTYPILMAADILLYNSNFVPVGSDQKQHLELTRDIAIRFNNKYGKTFVVPEPLIQKQGARIMSLSNPENKMSKSDSEKFSSISVLDTPKEIRKKIMKSQTDSDMKVKFDEENKKGISNLLTIYSLFTDSSISELEEKYEGKGYGDFKKDLAEVIINELNPVKERYNKIMDSGKINEILKNGAIRANEVSKEILNDVKQKVGFVTF